jgi:hypothetical protein
LQARPGKKRRDDENIERERSCQMCSIYLTMMDSIEALNASMDTVLDLGADVFVWVLLWLIEFELTVAAPKTAAVEVVASEEVVGTTTGFGAATTTVAGAGAAAEEESLLR